MFHTSDRESRGRLKLAHAVFRHTGERALVVNGSLLHPQHVVVLVILDLVPGIKNGKW